MYGLSTFDRISLSFNASPSLVCILNSVLFEIDSTLMNQLQARFDFSVFEHFSLPWILLDLEGGIVQSNSAFNKKVRFDTTKRGTANLQSLLVSEDVPAFRENLKLLSSGKSDLCLLAKRFLGPEGKMVGADFYAALICDDQGSPTSVAVFLLEAGGKGSGKDTDQRLAQLVHASKLASVGTLAAGLAHEINNPLTIIKGNLSILKDGLGDDRRDIEREKKLIERQERACDRIVTIINSLRTYARSDTEYVETVDLQRIMADTMVLVEPIIKKTGIELVTALTATQPLVRGNIGKIQQIIMSLTSNACDALEKKEGSPQVKIEVFNEAVSGKNWVVLRVSDNGCGIEPRHLSHIYDPFFTTKPPGKGAGLGLSMSQSIVQSMNGDIQIESTIGIGTTVTVRIPVFKEGELQNQLPRPEEAIRWKGKVLIVDDEDDIRGILQSYLQDTGIQIVEASDGQMGLQKIKENSFDIMITDVKMPRMSGEVLIQEVKKLNLSHLKIIVITGGIVTDYTKEQREIIRLYADGYLKKPFDKKTLLEMIKKVREKVTS